VDNQHREHGQRHPRGDQWSGGSPGSEQPVMPGGSARRRRCTDAEHHAGSEVRANGSRADSAPDEVTDSARLPKPFAALRALLEVSAEACGDEGMLVAGEIEYAKPSSYFGTAYGNLTFAVTRRRHPPACASTAPWR